MKVKGYMLEIDGELCPVWFRPLREKRILAEDADALLPPNGDAKIRNVTIYVRRRNNRRKSP